MCVCFISRALRPGTTLSEAPPPPVVEHDKSVGCIRVRHKFLSFRCLLRSHRFILGGEAMCSRSISFRCLSSHHHFILAGEAHVGLAQQVPLIFAISFTHTVYYLYILWSSLLCLTLFSLFLRFRVCFFVNCVCRRPWRFLPCVSRQTDQLGESAEELPRTHGGVGRVPQREMGRWQVTAVWCYPLLRTTFCVCLCVLCLCCPSFFFFGFLSLVHIVFADLI